MDKELLEPLRSRIDEIDSEILSLVNERAKVALAVGKLKEEHSDSSKRCLTTDLSVRHKFSGS